MIVKRDKGKTTVKRDGTMVTASQAESSVFRLE